MSHPQQQRVRFDTATEGLDPPLALVDLDAFDQNAADWSRAAGSPSGWPASRCAAATCWNACWRVPGYAGLLAYSLRRSPVAVRRGTATTSLVAYPTVTGRRCAQLAADETGPPHVTIMVDSASTWT